MRLMGDFELSRAESVCKAYAKRQLALQATSNQRLVDRRKNFRFRCASHEWDFAARFWDKLQTATDAQRFFKSRPPVFVNAT